MRASFGVRQFQRLLQGAGRSLVAPAALTAALAWNATAATEPGIDPAVVDGGPGIGCQLDRDGAAMLPLDQRRGGFARCDQGTRKGSTMAVVYQYSNCPFCNVARASLDYAGVPYAMVDVNPLIKREVGFTKYTKVPIAIVNGMEVHDSSCVVDYLDELVAEADRSLGIDSPQRLYAEDTEESRRWRKWAYARFVHILSPNIYRTTAEAIQSFEFMMDADHSTMSYLEALAGKWVGATIMWAVGKRLMSKHGFDKEGDGTPRQALYRCIDEWINAVESVPGRAFMGGDRPSRADVTVFGMLRAIEGLDSFRDALGNTRMEGWYRRMEVAVGDSACLHRVSNRGTAGITGVRALEASAVDRFRPAGGGGASANRGDGPGAGNANGAEGFEDGPPASSHDSSSRQ